MSWEDFERLLCFMVLSASAMHSDSPWSRELEREFLERWPVPGERPTPRTRQPPRIQGATSNTRTLTWDQLPASHPLKNNGGYRP
jgi:hypothetical protein